MRDEREAVCEDKEKNKSKLSNSEKEACINSSTEVVEIIDSEPEQQDIYVNKN